MDKIKIAIGKSEKSKTLTHKEVSWAQIVKKYSTHKVAAKKGGEYVVGGHFSKDLREGEYLVARTLLVIDIDAYAGSIEDLEFDLSLLPYRFVAYSSFQHTSDKPRVRVIAPLSREVTADEYRVMAHQACLDMTVPIEAIDKCSWTPNQAMFAPQHMEGADNWTMTQEGEAFSVPDVIPGCITTGAVDEDDDLMAELARTPLDMSEAEVDAHLAVYPADGLDYDGWLAVGMALWHQSRGEWFDKWVAWSAQSPKHDASQMKAKWRSFGGSSNPVTMASVIHHVKQAGGVVSVPDAFDAMLEEASEIETLDQYDTFAKRIRSMSDAILPPVRRGMLISELASGFGESNGIGKTEIKRELQPHKRGKAEASDDGMDIPEWLNTWVYVETPCLFAHTEIADYAIKREAFNAKFDRKPECLSMEKRAADAALVNFRIKTVADSMFFPGAGKFFDYDGKHMLNSYSDKGVSPCGDLDADGQAVVDMFLRHLAFTIESPVEQQIMLNWMAYIYQNPGKRVGWAMLLQGAQGCGKSYFGAMFQQLWGSNVRQLDTGAISGRFTGWAHGALLNVVEEIRIAGTNKWEILDKLKPIISNDTIQIEEKGRDHRTVPNFTSYLLLTNHKDAVPIGDGDRRYCCIFSRIQSEEQLLAHFGSHEARKAYFDRLFDETRRRADAIASFLAAYKISAGFDPIGRAPDTSARTEMKALSVSSARDSIEDRIERHRCKVISDSLLDVTWLNKLCESEGEKIENGGKIATILSEIGYSPIEGRRVKISGNGYHYIWIKGAQLSDDAKNTVREFHSKDIAGDEGIPF